ncbi:MAG: hypothetical protein KC561_13995, partial [Myxococcales bacterium]|nr:hypothetical protein [Myxococcales bacterium]
DGEDDFFLCGETDHFSIWGYGYDFEPVRACLAGAIYAEHELTQPLAGARVWAVGQTFQGLSTTVTTNANGEFSCLEVLRSELGGTDENGNNVTGENHWVEVFAQIGDDAPVSLGVRMLGVSISACVNGETPDSGSCQVLGDFVPPSDVAFCPFLSEVRDGGDDLVPSSDLFVINPSLSVSDLNSLCGEIPTEFDECAAAESACVLCDTAADGTGARMVVPYVIGSTFALVGRADVLVPGDYTASVYGARLIEPCPTAALVYLEESTAWIDLIGNIADDGISWSPDHPISRLTVFDAEGQPKWEISASAATPQLADLIVPPVEYGVVPSNATQDFPAGSPGALESGDVILIEIDYDTDDGLRVRGCWSQDPGVASCPSPIPPF